MATDFSKNTCDKTPGTFILDGEHGFIKVKENNYEEFPTGVIWISEDEFELCTFTNEQCD